jgi:hypothetical protein
MRTDSIWHRIVLAAALLALAAAPLAAADLTVESGLDIWITRGDGSTFFSFADEPLPAGFFCSASAPFAGAVVFKGVPVATSPPDALGGADTILQRLDHAVFNKRGVATTRLQLRALHFVGTEPLSTSCGSYRVEVVLDGEQPITEMRIFRESRKGGRFAAEVAVNAKLVFTPVDHPGEVLELSRSVVFPPRRNSFWTDRPGKGGISREGFVQVDTNADGSPDTFLPGTSRNFAAGWPAKARPEGGALTAKALPCGENCHCDPSCSNHCLCPPGEICRIDAEIE